MIESSELVDSGGLIKPHKDLSELIKIADTVLECKVKKSKDIFKEKKYFQKLSIKALTVVSEQRPSLLGEIDCEHDKKVSHRVKTSLCHIFFNEN